jgi:hypothetical protein
VDFGLGVGLDDHIENIFKDVFATNAEFKSSSDVGGRLTTRIGTDPRTVFWVRVIVDDNTVVGRGELEIGFQHATVKVVCVEVDGVARGRPQHIALIDETKEKILVADGMEANHIRVHVEQLDDMGHDDRVRLLDFGVHDELLLSEDLWGTWERLESGSDRMESSL